MLAGIIPESRPPCLGIHNGWKIEPLTFVRINRMTADEAAFHEKRNKVEFERALNEPKVRAENKANLEASKTQRMWADQATPEETQAALDEVQIFCHVFPQFRGDYVPNR